MFKPLDKDDPRFNGWIVKQRLKGHDRSYTYLYWREDKKLRKQYIPLDQVSQVRKAFRQERQRRKKVKEEQELEKLQNRLNSSVSYARGYIRLFLRYAVVEDMPDGTTKVHYEPVDEYIAKLKALMYRSLHVRQTE